MSGRAKALSRFAPILVGAACGVLALVLLLPFLSSPMPGPAEWVLTALGILAIVGLVALAGHLSREAGRHEARADRLQRRLEDVEPFAVAARHDLREPLRKIITFGERLRDRLGPIPDPQLDRYAERMSDAAERMQGMLDELTVQARVNDEQTRCERFRSRDVIERVLADLADALLARNGEVTLGDLPEIRTDPDQFRTLFGILLSNAIQYADEARPLRVTVDGEIGAGGSVVIRVADNGIGFDPDKADRIFAPFQRLHTREAYPGTGIGLATARKIAERQGGQLLGRGEIGIGAVFTLILPQQKASL